MIFILFTAENPLNRVIPPEIEYPLLKEVVDTYVLVSGSTDRPKFEYACVPADISGVNALRTASLRAILASSMSACCILIFAELLTAYSIQSLSVVITSCALSRDMLRSSPAAMAVVLVIYVSFCCNMMFRAGL